MDSKQAVEKDASENRFLRESFMRSMFYAFVIYLLYINK